MRGALAVRAPSAARGVPQALALRAEGQFDMVAAEPAGGRRVPEEGPVNAAHQRVEIIRQRLAEALMPASLSVIDDSHRHAGHEGARDGRGHFNVDIVSSAFEGQMPLARHRMVYSALGELMATDIHALAIRARTPGEAAS
jgi:BolA protein